MTTIVKKEFYCTCGSEYSYQGSAMGLLGAELAWDHFHHGPGHEPCSADQCRENARIIAQYIKRYSEELDAGKVQNWQEYVKKIAREIEQDEGREK